MFPASTPTSKKTKKQFNLGEGECRAFQPLHRLLHFGISAPLPVTRSMTSPPMKMTVSKRVTAPSNLSHSSASDHFSNPTLAPPNKKTPEKAAKEKQRKPKIPYNIGGSHLLCVPVTSRQVQGIWEYSPTR